MSDPWDGILQQGEEIRWQGRPDGAFRIVAALIPTSVFGLVFFGFALFWIGMAASMGTGTALIDLLFPLFGLPFALVGLWLMVGTHLWDAIRRRGSFYTLTNQRGFIATDLPILGRRLSSIPLEPDRFAMTARNGLYDVSFGETRRTEMSSLRVAGSSAVSWPPRVRTLPISFESLPDARELMAELTRIKEEQAR